MKSEDGDLIEDMEQLRNLAVGFYTNLFSSDTESGGNFISGMFLAMGQEALQKLEAIYTLLKYASR